MEWQYFFGSSGRGTFSRYYKSFIGGVRVEKCATNKGTLYSVGNYDEARKKFNTEEDLEEWVRSKKQL